MYVSNNVEKSRKIGNHFPPGKGREKTLSMGIHRRDGLYDNSGLLRKVSHRNGKIY